MKIVVPFGNKILIKANLLEDEKVSETGIVYQTQTQRSNSNIKNSSKASVLEIGDEVMKIKKHDLVIYETHAGYSFELEGEHFILISESNILGVIKNEKKN